MPFPAQTGIQKQMYVITIGGEFGSPERLGFAPLFSRLPSRSLVKAI
jgi:hypothetical protein